jgi:TatD DNase family protein
VIDFHCHLDLYPNALQLLDEVERRNEFTLAVTTSPRAYVATSRVFAGRPRIHVGLGLHPEIAEAKQGEQALLVELVTSTRFIGEIGLDGSSRFKHSLPVQERIFTAVVEECQRQGGRVMSMHSRGAESRLLDILATHPKAGIPVLHWFSGTPKELQAAIAFGCWFSVGPAMLAGEKGRRLCSAMPLDRILPETDGPFTRQRGTALMPWEAANISAFLQRLTGKSNEEIHEIWRSNLMQLMMRDSIGKTSKSLTKE